MFKKTTIFFYLIFSIINGQWSKILTVYSDRPNVTYLDVEINSKDQISIAFDGSSMQNFAPEDKNYPLTDEIYIGRFINSSWQDPERIVYIPESGTLVRTAIYRIDENDIEYILWGETPGTVSPVPFKQVKYISNLHGNLSVPETFKDARYKMFHFFDFAVGKKGKQAIYTGQWGVEDLIITEKDVGGWKYPYKVFPEWDANSTNATQTAASLSYGTDNLLDVCFYGETPEDSAWYYQKVRLLLYTEQEADGTWKDPVRIVEKPQRVMSHAEIIVDENNVRHVIWFDIRWKASYPESIKYSSSPDGVNWSEPIVIARADEPGEQVMDKSFTVDKNSTAHIFWRRMWFLEDPSEPLTLEYTTVKNSIKENTHIVAEYKGSGATPFFDLAVEKSGRVHFFWNIRSKDKSSGLHSINIMHRYYGGPIERKKINTAVEVKSFPNPFNSDISIQIDPRETMVITVSFYDINGRLITTLLRNQKIYGTKYLKWDGRNENMDKVPSGVYFVKVQGQTTTDKEVNYTQKMLLLR